MIYFNEGALIEWHIDFFLVEINNEEEFALVAL